jgi:hypothetical protein
MPKLIESKTVRIVKILGAIFARPFFKWEKRSEGDHSQNRAALTRALGAPQMLRLAVLLASLPAYCQNPQPDAQNTKWDFGVWVAGETGEETENSLTQAQILSAGVFGGRVLTGERGRGWRRGRLEYLFDFMPVFVTWGNQNTHGVGFDPVMFRWNSSLHKGRVSPYIELSGGAVATPTNLPAGDTSDFNFMAKGGGGIYVRTGPRQAFDIALRWSHISNANLGDYNPAFNGIQLYVSYHFFK